MKQNEVEAYVSANNLLNDLRSSSGIYAITIDKRIVYVGQSINVRQRCLNHIYLIENAYFSKENKYRLLLSAKLGGHIIDCVDLVYCAPTDLDSMEDYFIEMYKPPLNILTPHGKNKVKDLMIEDLLSILFTYCREEEE